MLTFGTLLDSYKCVNVWYVTGQLQVCSRLVRYWTAISVLTFGTLLDSFECVNVWYVTGQLQVC